MRAFRFHNPREEKIRWSFAIDPGLKTTGFCLLFHEEGGSVTTWSADKSMDRVMGISYPELYSLVSSRVDLYKRQLPAAGSMREGEVVIEYSFLQGIFSLGIATLVSMLTRTLLKEVGVGRVVMIPPKIPQYFLRVRSASDSEIKKFVREKFPASVFKKGKPSPHEADAILFLSYLYPGIMKSRYGADLREPKLEYVDIKEQ